MDPHFEIKIVTENDMINHNNKSEPFIPFYNIKNIEINNLVGTIDIFYNFQYIKYDSDNGIFFQNFKSYDLISFSDLSYDTGDNLIPGYITFCIYFNYTGKKITSITARLSSMQSKQQKTAVFSIIN